MFKSKMFATMTLVFAAAAVLSTMSIARTAFAEGASDVFMDEGDGDFDSMPAPPAAEEPKADVPKVAEPRPAVKEEPQQDEMPMLVDDGAAPAATPAPTEDPAQPAEAKPKKEKKPAAAKKKKATAAKDGTSVKAAGQFVTTKDACPMMRSPASTGETMLTVKASKKIWVEDAGDGWVKAFNKAGEPGYVSKDCVE
jgi:hypothetical protein